MTRINSHDQLMRLLDATLRASTASKSQKIATGKTPAARTRVRPLERLRTLLQIEDVSDRDAEQLLLGAILGSHFGPRVASEPAFQSLVEQVRQQIEDDSEVGRLLSQAVAELRRPPARPG